MMQKIKKIDSYIYNDKFLFVRLETESGAVGAGEATGGDCAQVKKLIDTVLAPALAGRDLACSNYLEVEFFPKDDLGDDAMRRAVAGVEMASWDALGNATGVPVYKILGGNANPMLRTVGCARCDKVDNVRVSARADLVPGEALRPLVLQKAADPRPMVIELEGELDAANIPALLRGLARLDPWYVTGLLPDDQPWTWEETSHQAKVPVALKASSRYEVYPLPESAPMSVVEADVIAAGGLGGLKLLASYLETYYLRIAAGVSGSALAAAAAAQVLLTCPNGLSWSVPVSGAEDVVSAPKGLTSDEPGLGVKVDWSKLR